MVLETAVKVQPYKRMGTEPMDQEFFSKSYISNRLCSLAGLMTSHFPNENIIFRFRRTALKPCPKVGRNKQSNTVRLFFKSLISTPEDVFKLMVSALSIPPAQ